MTSCGEQYCQSGPKYGNECYTINEVEWQESSARAEPPEERATEPAPGCALLNADGVYDEPMPGNGSGVVRANQRPQSYAMSGACVTRRRTEHGAVR